MQPPKPPCRSKQLKKGAFFGKHLTAFVPFQTIMHSVTISKSQFLRGLQCPKSLWLNRYSPESRDQTDAAKEALFSSGNEAGKTARALYPGGEEILFNASDFGGMLKKTSDLLKGGCEVIYEASFSRGGIFVMADILVKKGSHWELFEVKSSTSVKEYQIQDTAVQWYVISQVLPLKEAAVIHINTGYTRKGALEPDKLFNTEYITDQVLFIQEEIPLKLGKMKDILSGPCPETEIGEHCSLPFVCDFYNHCRKDIPEPSVFSLTRLSGAEKYRLYRSGVATFKDIPGDYPLTETQKLQIHSTLTGEIFINKEVIKKFVKKINYPVHYLDFETYSEPVPSYDMQRPYQHIPFQYALYKENEDGILKKYEFLADDSGDPRLPFTEQLLRDLEPEGTIIAYSMSFEKSILRLVSQLYPSHRKSLDELPDRFEDLLEVFRGKGLYYPEFNGSFSIKSVLPAMFPDDPELRYNSLQVQNGQMAMETWGLLRSETDPDAKRMLRESLLRYCGLDAYAMVKIMRKLRELAD